MPTTLSLSTSFRASAACCAGLSCSSYRMYLIGRPLMPPLSLTQSKYAFATLPTVVKSTPGMSMSMPPSLIGVPVAFLPVPRPQTDFFADALPDPTGACAPVAQPASIKASRHAPAAAPPIIVFVDRMDPSNWVAREVVLPNSRGRGRVTPRQGLARCTPLTSTCLRARRLRAGRDDRASGGRATEAERHPPK